MPKAHQKNSVNPTTMHPRNNHIGRYDLALLSKTLPELEPFLTTNPNNQSTINFSDATAVKLLNKALLMQYYGLQNWNIPDGFLCPPIPGRADYIHHIAEFLEKNHVPKATHQKPFNHKDIVALDIGTGANAIYPIIASHCYGWNFIVSDIDAVALHNVKKICQQNPTLSNHIEIRQQNSAKNIFTGLITQNDSVDITVCNPPFHASLADATASSTRKRNNLQRNQIKRKPTVAPSKNTNALNFGGQKAELWCEGGEIAFLKNMVHESKAVSKQVKWFSSLVSKSENSSTIQQLLKKLQASHIHVIPMQHGQKITRVIVWSW